MAAMLTKFELSRDVETNPGHVDGSKTIKALYSQDNVTLFGLNAGSHCVSMSLTTLICNDRNTIFLRLAKCHEHWKLIVYLLPYLGYPSRLICC